MTNAAMRGIIYLAFAGVAHLVERDLAKVEVASSSLVARSKKKHHPSGWCFLFGMPRAGLNSLPRPARSALNQEVRQGSCEWLCHSWDAGSESSLVTFFAFAVCEAYKQQNLWAAAKRNTIRQDGVRLSKNLPVTGIGGKDSVKGNRQGSLSRSITRRSDQNRKIKYCFLFCDFACSLQLVKKVRSDFFDKLTPSVRMVFLFGMSRASLNSLPRPARSASDPEVRC